MRYLIRLGVAGLALACILAILAMVATMSKSVETIQYDELTCDELVLSYRFNVEVLQDMLLYYDGCKVYADEVLSGHPHGPLVCEFIKEHALFVKGIAQDLADVYNIKCAPE